VFSEAIESICAAEEEARQRILLEQQKAHDAIEDAEKLGAATVAGTLARAESEIAHLTRISDKKVTEDAKELASRTANRQAALRARAERRLDAAVQLIVERIVTA